MTLPADIYERVYSAIKVLNGIVLPQGFHGQDKKQASLSAFEGLSQPSPFVLPVHKL